MQSSVKSRIMQFQQNTSTSSSGIITTTTSPIPNGVTRTTNQTHVKSTPNIVSVINDTTSTHCNNNITRKINVNNSSSHFPLPVLNRTCGVNSVNINSSSSASANNNNSSNNFVTTKTNGLSTSPSKSRHPSRESSNSRQIINHPQQNNSQIDGDLRKSELVNGNYTNNLYNNLVSKSELKTINTSSMSNQNPPVDRATKPNIMSKKASMTINLSSSTATNNNTNPSPVNTFTNGNSEQQQRPKFLRSPSKTVPPSPTSAIPKPFGTNLGSNGALHSIGRKSPGSKTNTPATAPTRSNEHINVAFGSGTSSTGRFYGAIGWKEKYEESEKKKNHLVNLAQKATRDYEELRRRYNDLAEVNEKLSRRLDGATGQLGQLQKASEAVYEDYYKLKKRYESENREKTDAITRVDQYNKENRRLKRQSAALMMQINDPTSLASAFDAVCETDSAENDKEILYLRSRVQELEAKVVDLESELEKTKLAEFETQESVMLMNDSVNSIKSENMKLKEQLKQLDEENRKAVTALEDVTFEYESLKINYGDNEEKLTVVEVELKKLLNEKNILQRQSLVFMNDAMDNRLLDALNQIGDLQTALEEQKQRFENQLSELQHQLTDRESNDESLEIQTAARIRSLEQEVLILRKRAEEAEQKLEELPIQNSGPPPPPPPPLPMGMGCPPPPPMPLLLGPSLNSSLKSAMGTLKKSSGYGTNGSGSCSENSTPPNGVSTDGSPKLMVGHAPQIDDVISQLKKGIKLKPMDRTILRNKPTEIPQEKPEDTAVEEMRSILNNLRRTRRSP